MPSRTRNLVLMAAAFLFAVGVALTAPVITGGAHAQDGAPDSKPDSAPASKPDSAPASKPDSKPTSEPEKKDGEGAGE